MTMNREETLKRDDILIAFLAQHIGRENCVSAKKVSEYLTERGYNTTTNAIHNIIRRVMFRYNLPICHSNSNGYFWAKDKEDIRLAIDDLQNRISEMNKRIDLLKKLF